ncbi:MAG: endolytic transglycosylase MltG, partial [Bacteroidales bacterium]|nr:endolytic transglycosylase MltG [Bacteroidales bacterium]
MKKRLIILAVIAAIGIIVTVGALSLVGTRTTNSEPVRLNLPENTTYEALCDSLHAQHIITPGLNTHIFNFLFSTFKSKVRSGSYLIEPRMRTLALVRKLRNGQQDPIRLIIGKFRTPEQLNDFLNQKLMHNDFRVTLDSFYLIRPNTYEFYWTVTPDAFMQRMKREYDKTGVDKETVILASIVEEETNNNQEKPLVASVYLNRLKRGMPLQADPTVKYAVGDFTLRRILNKHLAVESPFNTYLHTGLPPAPICLPSQASIEAVINAPETQYLYFCASPAMDGTHRFAATLAEHNRNAAAFHT